VEAVCHDARLVLESPCSMLVSLLWRPSGVVCEDKSLPLRFVSMEVKVRMGRELKRGRM